MPSLTCLAMFLQDDVNLAHDLHMVMIAQWIMAICVLVVILCLLIGALVILALVRKVEKKVDTVTNTVQGKALPLMAQSQEVITKVREIVTDLQPRIKDIVADLQPKIASISGDVEHISNVVRAKVDEVGQTVTRVNTTVQDVNGKTQAQVTRVNGMVSDALTTTEHVSRSIQHGIRVPIDKVVGWVAAAKGGIETLAAKMPFMQHTTHRGPARPWAPPAAGSTTTTTTGTAAPGGPPFVPSPGTTTPRR